jgi:hypothetical protein
MLCFGLVGVGKEILKTKLKENSMRLNVIS